MHASWFNNKNNIIFSVILQVKYGVSGTYVDLNPTLWEVETLFSIDYARVDSRIIKKDGLMASFVLYHVKINNKKKSE